MPRPSRTLWYTLSARVEPFWQSFGRSQTPRFPGPHGGDMNATLFVMVRVYGGGHDRENCVMKREWPPDELMAHWTILPHEHKLLGNKSGPTRLGFAVLLKYFQYEGRFPQHPREVPSGIVTYLAQQL